MSDIAVTAGRGVLYIAFAKLYFMIAGYAINFMLPRLLTFVMWGRYSFVNGVVSIIDNCIVTGTIQGVSRYTAQHDDNVSGVKAAALKAQLMLGGLIGLLYALSAPLLAWVFKNDALLLLFVVSAGIVLSYSFYAVFVGSLNGTKQFGRQATLDIAFATLRALTILGAAAAGLGAAGAIGGFASAAAVILLVSAIWVGLPRPGSPRFSVQEIWRFTLVMFVYTALFNLAMRVDMLLLGHYLPGFAHSADKKVAADFASTYVGYYNAAGLLAFLPYQAILAAAFVIFPLVSRSTFDNDLGTTQAYIRKTLRLSLIFVVGVSSVLIGNPEAVIRVVYPRAMSVAGPSLQALSVGIIGYAMFTVINTIMNGAGRKWLAILAAAVLVVAAAAANWLAITQATTPLGALKAAGWATAGANLLGAVVATVFLQRSFRASFSLLTLARVGLALGAAIVVGRLVPDVSRLVTLMECALVLVVYVVALVLSRELTKDDLQMVLRVVARKGP